MLEYRYLPVHEDTLPEDQEPVQTRSLTQFATQARLLMNTKRQTGYSMIGVTTGRPGAGKTVAIQDFLRKQQMQPHTGLPACIEIRVKPDSTPKAFVEDLLLRLEDQRRPRLEHTRYKLSDRAAELIVGHDIQLLIVDEAEQLTMSGFEFLRYLFGKTGCPLLLVGLESMLPVLEYHEKLSSRIGLAQDFLSPSEEEILTIVLPHLVLPRWTYNAELPEDYAMGKDLWDHARPSFRKLRVILQVASQVACLDENVARITPDFLSAQVYPLLRQARKKRSVEENTEPPVASTYDEESRQRQESRQKKGRKKAE